MKLIKITFFSVQYFAFLLAKKKMFRTTASIHPSVQAVINTNKSGSSELRRPVSALHLTILQREIHFLSAPLFALSESISYSL